MEFGLYNSRERLLRGFRCSDVVSFSSSGCPEYDYKSKSGFLFLRKSVMSIKFPPVILGPEMAAPILWVPGIFGFFLLETPMPIKYLLLGGGGLLGFLEGGGWKCQLHFYGRGDSSDFRTRMDRQVNFPDFFCVRFPNYSVGHAQPTTEDHCNGNVEIGERLRGNTIRGSKTERF